MALIGPDLPKIPSPLKSIQQYLTIAAKHDQRDSVVSYWCMYTITYRTFLSFNYVMIFRYLRIFSASFSIPEKYLLLEFNILCLLYYYASWRNVKISRRNRPSLCSSNWIKAIYEDIGGNKFFIEVNGLVGENEERVT